MECGAIISIKKYKDRYFLRKPIGDDGVEGIEALYATLELIEDYLASIEREIGVARISRLDQQE